LLGCFALAVGACEKSTSNQSVANRTAGEPNDNESKSPDSRTPRPLFVEVAGESGIDFVHQNGATGEFYFPELMGQGCAWLDYDGDGLLDAYLLQGGPIPVDPDQAPGNQLYRNKGNGSFENVTAKSGAGDRGWSVGVACGDTDNDGDVDMYVTNVGRDVFYLNQGDGTFRVADVGIDDDDTSFGASATFLDYDADGHLDLFVCNYIGWSPNLERPCTTTAGTRDYCHPSAYNRLHPDRLYRNKGDGTFEDVTLSSGIGLSLRTGLGVYAGDFNGDGRMDIFVANDGMANTLWINSGNGRFVDEGMKLGCALNEQGVAEAGMGVACADVDDEGDLDLIITHMDGETNTFFRQNAEFFDDETAQVRLAEASLPYTGFGIGFFDYDCDGVLDLFVANGRMRSGAPPRVPKYAEPCQLFRGLDRGRYQWIQGPETAALSEPAVGRGAAFGDYDNDGDVDVLVTNVNGSAKLFRNEARDGRHWLGLRVLNGKRDAVGARVSVTAGEHTYHRVVQPGYGYGTSNDPRIHLGLGSADQVELVEVSWIDGTKSRLENVKADQWITIEKGR
jgi:hypothetical protein